MSAMMSALLLLIPTVSANFFLSQPCATGSTSSCGSSYGAYSSPVMSYGVPTHPQGAPIMYAAQAQYPPQQHQGAPIMYTSQAQYPPQQQQGAPIMYSPQAPQYPPQQQPMFLQPPPPPPPPLQLPPPPPMYAEVSRTEMTQVPQSYAKPVYPVRPAPIYRTPAPVYVTTPPPPICWMNEDGLECCSRELGSLMREFLNSQRAPRGCNLQKIANDLQMMAHTHFNYSFESVIAQSQMANKIHFIGRLMCKVRTNEGKIALLYATPKQYSLEQFDYHPLTAEEEEAKGWSGIEGEVLSLDDPRLFGATGSSRRSVGPNVEFQGVQGTIAGIIRRGKLAR